MNGDLKRAADQVLEAKVVLFDWDGCLSQGGALLPGARKLLNLLGGRAFVLSNNSTDQPGEVQARLAADQVRIDRDHILLAGHQTLLRQAVDADGQRVHLLADPRMMRLAASLGMQLTLAEADRVVILRDPTFDFAKLQAAANAARRCRRIVIANPDLTHPGLNGDVVPETGALHAAIAACVADVEVSLEVVGKPSPFLFELALARAGVAPREALMVGDNPDTDGAGAAACGIPFLLVRPGGPLSLGDLAPIVEDLLTPAQRSASL